MTLWRQRVKQHNTKYYPSSHKYKPTHPHKLRPFDKGKSPPTRLHHKDRHILLYIHHPNYKLLLLLLPNCVFYQLVFYQTYYIYLSRIVCLLFWCRRNLKYFIVQPNFIRWALRINQWNKRIQIHLQILDSDMLPVHPISSRKLPQSLFPSHTNEGDMHLLLSHENW